MYTITIGDKAYSSWSMRGWLLLAGFGIRFEEEVVRMYDPAFSAMQAANAPARQVPQLAWTEGGERMRIWDTMAIAEALAERHPAAGHWPREARDRAVARTLAAEMHSGFPVLRAACPMNLHRVERPLAARPDGLETDLDRLAQLWAWALDRSGGPWLCGEAFGAADAFYAPVASRLESYALMRPGLSDHARRLLAHPAVAGWIAAGRADPRRIARYDDLP